MPLSLRNVFLLIIVAILQSTMLFRRRVIPIVIVLATGVRLALADEGMWLFNNPTLGQLKQKYQFEPTKQWLDHLQKASVRFNSGGSGSFVSANGLVITNHHVGLDTLQKISTEQNNYARDGFYAKTEADEVRATDLELNVLVSIEDVTERVSGAVKLGMSAEDATKARAGAIAQIEKESKEKTGLRSDIVTLYQGGIYNLYRYKRYDDVRLVFAPEQQIAFYGGDPDNFEYPRYDLDVCFFRAYENGQPVKPEHFLRWNSRGPTDGDLIFVSGSPGRTDRQLTVDELRDLRDRDVPNLLQIFNRREVLLSTWSQRSFENARRARDDLFSDQNNRKRCDGYLAALLDPEIWAAIQTREQKLRDAITRNPALTQTISAFERIKNAQAAIAHLAPRYDYLEQERRSALNAYRQPRALVGNLFKYARLIVRAADERAKPNGERIATFRDSNRESLELELFSTAPVHDDFEQLGLSDSLTDLAEKFGADDPVVKQVLAGKSPHDRAVELVNGTKLKDVAFRKQLYAMDSVRLIEVHDPMIDLARPIEAPAREVRRQHDGQEEIKEQAYAEIARARFEIEGRGTYPDATFTLRLSYGTVRGYEQNAKSVPPFTNFAGLYQRAAEHNNRPPFDLPQRWIDRKANLDPNTPLNFVSDPDIIGGNSGSPVVNKANDFVGIIFDGNIQSLVLNYIYSNKQARAVSVDSAAITEALRKLYDANALVDELEAAAR